MTVNSKWFSFASALLLLMAFEPANAWALLFVGLAPILYRLGEPNVRPFRCGYGFGLIYGLGQLLWIAQLVERWTKSPILAILVLVLATSLFAIYFGIAGWLIQRCWRFNLPWLIPFCWCGIEVFRSYIPVFAFPWGLLASPLWHAPVLMHPARFGTIFGVGSLIALANTSFAVLLRDKNLRRFGPMLALCVTVFAATFCVQYFVPRGVITRVSSGQPGVDLAFGDPKTSDLAVDFNVQRTQQQARRDHTQLLVLPEGLVHTGPKLPPDLPFEISSGIPIVFGGLRGNKPAYQSAFGYDGQWSVINKTRLVIFGEFVPGRNWIPFLDQFHLPSGDISAGERVQALQLGNLTVGPLICFEALFPDIAYRQAMNGSQVLAVMSMDDWFANTNAPDQLRAASVWRSVETGKPLVRAATTGYSFITDGTGTIVGQSPLSVQTTLTRDIQVRAPDRPWWLPVFPILCFAFTAWFTAASTVQLKRSTTQK